MLVLEISSYLRRFGADIFLSSLQCLSYAILIFIILFSLLAPEQQPISSFFYQPLFLIPYLDVFLALLTFLSIEVVFYKTENLPTEYLTRKALAILVLFLVGLGSIAFLYYINEQFLLYFFLLSVIKDAQTIIFREEIADAHTLYKKNYTALIIFTSFSLFVYFLITTAGTYLLDMTLISVFLTHFTNLWTLLWLFVAIYIRFPLRLSLPLHG
ncbi:MAG: hypothetical protein QXW70_03790 [Candidatus Anstonellales archaeon]